MTALSHRYDFVLLFDVANGNPNGDPDAGNLPRLDPETNQGLVSDVSLKRKVRNYAEIAKGKPRLCHLCPGRRDPQPKASESLYGDQARRQQSLTDKTLNPKDEVEANWLRDFMCKNFFDVRTFGAVMSTGINAGQVRGPIQVTFAQSVEPIVPQEISITRMAATNEAEKAKLVEGGENSGRRTAPGAAKISYLTASIARMDSFRPSSPNGPASPKPTFRSSGIRSETCSSTTDRRHEAKWRPQTSRLRTRQPARQRTCP